MWRKYKFNHTEQSRLFFTSDAHFRHAKLLESRGFKTIEEHDEFYLNAWNERVRPQDNVIFLGDFVLGAGRDSKQVCLDLFRRLNGHIWFLWGNHISGVKQIYKDLISREFNLNGDVHEIYPVTWGDKVTFVGKDLLAQVKYLQKTHFVYCSHFAHRIWIDSHKDVMHACGHSHGSDIESRASWPTGKRLDCGVESFGGPISFDYFLEIMDRKEVEILDHHDQRTSPSF